MFCLSCSQSNPKTSSETIVADSVIEQPQPQVDLGKVETVNEDVGVTDYPNETNGHPSIELMAVSYENVINNRGATYSDTLYKRSSIGYSIAIGERAGGEGNQTIDGNFSGLPRKECLVIFDDENDSHADAGYYVMLFYKNKKNVWKAENFYACAHGHPVQLKDLDSDKLPEIICRFETGHSGIMDDWTQIYTLKGGKAREIYSIKGINILDALIEWKKGKPLVIDYKISFFDENNDSILEIKENKKVKIFVDAPKDKDGSYIEDSAKYKKYSTTRILHLVNGKYR
jgi:hypothetical protein